MPPPPWASWVQTDRAERAIRFISSYCRLPKGHGAGQLMRLASFQVEFIRAIYSPGARVAVESIPRGNGKSSLGAALCLHATFDADPSGGAPQVPCIATRLLQVERSVFGVAVAMLHAEAELDNRANVFSGIGTRRIEVPANGGTMFPLSKDLAGLQGLDPSFALIDEVGFLPPESFDALVLASGKRPRSVVVGIGTPGIDVENALHAIRATVAVERPPGFVYREIAAPEGCALEDEDAWRAANPAIEAGFASIDALRTAVRATPEEDFRRYRLGQWVAGGNCWLGADAAVLWRSLTEDYEMADGTLTWCGVDVGLKRDSTAVCWVQHRDDGRLHASARVWDPRRDGALETSDVMAFLRELALTYDLRQVSFDPRLFELAGAQLLDEGLPMVEVPQSVERMTPIVGAAFEAIRRQELTHTPDPSSTATSSPP
jgi:phage terminase large subunit-like protein